VSSALLLAFAFEFFGVEFGVGVTVDRAEFVDVCAGEAGGVGLGCGCGEALFGPASMLKPGKRNRSNYPVRDTSDPTKPKLLSPT